MKIRFHPGHDAWYVDYETGVITGFIVDRVEVDGEDIFAMNKASLDENGRMIKYDQNDLHRYFPQARAALNQYLEEKENEEEEEKSAG